MIRLALAALLALSCTVVAAVTAMASPVCYVGASVGAQASILEANGAIEGVSIGTQSLLAGPEAGCDLRFDGVLIGALARYDFSNIKEQGFDSAGQWMLAARAGINLNPSTLVYGLAGLAVTKFDAPTLQSKSANGWIAGAGLEFDLGWKGTPLSLFAEYNFVRYQSIRFTDGEIGASLKPDEHIARVGVRFALGK
jgi:opacity protein-like surface antigen